MKNKQKVLCVDDEPINLLILNKTLRESFHVITANNGAEALEKLEKDAEIQLIISDMNMPGMSGLEFIQKASNTFNNKKYFILSGYDLTPEIQDAINSGLVIEYFQKPADFKYILKVLQS